MSVSNDSKAHLRVLLEARLGHPVTDDVVEANCNNLLELFKAVGKTLNTVKKQESQPVDYSKLSPYL
jgi:hypothetical protein